jgi:hypothetical protein
LLRRPRRGTAVFDWFAFRRRALIAVMVAGHVIMLHLLQDNIFDAAQFRGAA